MCICFGGRSKGNHEVGELRVLLTMNSSMKSKQYHRKCTLQNGLLGNFMEVASIYDARNGCRSYVKRLVSLKSKEFTGEGKHENEI